MNRYHTVYISAEAEKVIGTFSDSDDLSDRINRIINRYGDATLTECPSLTEKEWKCVCDNCSRRWDYMCSPQYLGVDIYDDEGLAEKWGIDSLDFAQRLSSMSYLQQCAVIEVVSRYLQNHKSCSCKSFMQCLENCGAKIKRRKNGRSRK